MSNKPVLYNSNVIGENDSLTHDTRSISKILKNFFSNLVQSLLTQPPDKYDLHSVIRYYSIFMILSDF